MDPVLEHEGSAHDQWATGIEYELEDLVDSW